WAGEYAKLHLPLSGERVVHLVQLAKEFALKVEQLIGEETRQWAAAFAQNLAQMEKEVAARWEERQKALGAGREASKPAAIQINVSNARAADGRQFEIVLQAGDGSDPVQQKVSGSQTWVRSPVAPGVYTIAATATINQKPAGVAQVVQIKPAE